MVMAIDKKDKRSHNWGGEGVGYCWGGMCWDEAMVEYGGLRWIVVGSGGWRLKIDKLCL